jgi:hypothetical protein
VTPLPDRRQVLAEVGTARENYKDIRMKKCILNLLAVASITMLTGCAWEVGGGTKHVTMQQTVGQQLTDLKKAKDSGALTDAEYEAQKAKLLGHK